MNIPDEVAWVRRVNSRWIVRENLRDSTIAYLDHLAVNDPGRLRVSCRRAKSLTETYGKGEDPKPWFYAALFSLASATEGGRFLAGHHFTCSAIPVLARLQHSSLATVVVNEETSEKARRIRQVLENLETNEIGGLAPNLPQR